jgi:hypothetical protein
MGVRDLRRNFQRPCQQTVGFFKPAQPGQHNTIIGQCLSIIGPKFYGISENFGSRRQITVRKQKSCQPDLVFGAFRPSGADLVDHRHLRLDGLNKSPCTVMRQRRIALCLQVLCAVRQVYRSQKICTAYK